MWSNVRMHSLYLFFIIFFMASSGCTVKYVADYDAGVKDEIIKISKEVDLFWGELLDTPVAERKYEKFREKYTAIETDIRGLVMRNEIRPLNKESTKQANIALELWIEDRDEHKKNDTFSDFVAKRHRQQYQRVFIAMAIGEDSKKTSAE